MKMDADKFSEFSTCLDLKHKHSKKQHFYLAVGIPAKSFSEKNLVEPFEIINVGRNTSFIFGRNTSFIFGRNISFILKYGSNMQQTTSTR